MKRLISLIAASLVLAAPAVAGLPNHPGAHARISIATHTAPKTIVSRQSIPAAAHAIVNVTFNSQRAQMVWNDSPQIVEYASHGVIVTLSFHKKDGPVTMRVASTRPSAHVRVLATVSWSL